MNNAAGQSPDTWRFRALHPVCVLVAALLFACGTSALRTVPAACVALLLGGLLLSCSGLPWRMVAKRLALVNTFFIFLWFFLPWQWGTSATTLWHIGPLSLHTDGLRRAMLVTLKGNAAVMVLLALPGSAGITANAKALLRLHVSPKLVSLMVLTYRYLQILGDEAGRILEAAKLRGFAPKTSLQTYKTYGYLAGMLLVRGWQRAGRVGEAMRLRGFQGQMYFLPDIGYSSASLIKGITLLLCCSVATITLVSIDWYWG